MFRTNIKNKNFFGVALLIIVLGIIVFTFCICQWFYNWWSLDFIFAIPSSKIIGGLIIIALGYIQLELELIRTRKKISE